MTALPSLWAVLLALWLRRSRRLSTQAHDVRVALALHELRWAPVGVDPSRAARWYDDVASVLDALPRERQAAVAAWAAVSAWTEAYEGAQGAVWGRLADAATPLARSLGDDTETAREADALAALGAAVWRRP